MGKRMLRGWQGPKAGRGVGSGRWGGWTGRRGDGEGGWQRGGGDGDREGESGRGQLGGRDGEGRNRDGKRLAVEVRRRWREG